MLFTPRQHLLFFGSLPLDYSFWFAKQILDQSNSNISLAFLVLAQNLVKNPFDKTHFQTVESLLGKVTIDHGYKGWLIENKEQIKKFWGLTTDKILSLLEATKNDPAVLKRIFFENNHPHIRWHILFRIWRLGDADLLKNLGQIFAKECDYFRVLWNWIKFRLGLDIDITLEKRNRTYLDYNLLAEIFFKQGEVEEAVKYWLLSLKFDPSQIYLIYRIYESFQISNLPNINDYNIHIVLYTYNKLDTTFRTLNSLLNSDIGNSKITLLNNGSTKFSPSILEDKIKQLDGFNKINLIHLPVNIGAPAARNWLWNLPDSQEADFVVFLDDDVLLPHEWLKFYIQDFLNFPNIVVVGPKVVNPNGLRTIQYVFRYFQEIGRYKIRFTANSPEQIDWGQYDYRRPCLSVMGCCHMFDVRRWKQKQIPWFDVRFSPSQVDDLEHDLQIWLQGGEVLYDGRVEVMHLQDAGKNAIKDRASWAHVWGNHMKMEAKFMEKELITINNRVEQKENEYFRKIFKEVKDILPSTAVKFVSLLMKQKI